MARTKNDVAAESAGASPILIGEEGIALVEVLDRIGARIDAEAAQNEAA